MCWANDAVGVEALKVQCVGLRGIWQRNWNNIFIIAFSLACVWSPETQECFQCLRMSGWSLQRETDLFPPESAMLLCSREEPLHGRVRREVICTLNPLHWTFRLGWNALSPSLRRLCFHPCPFVGWFVSRTTKQITDHKSRPEDGSRPRVDPR